MQLRRYAASQSCRRQARGCTRKPASGKTAAAAVDYLRNLCISIAANPTVRQDMSGRGDRWLVWKDGNDEKDRVHT